MPLQGSRGPLCPQHQPCASSQMQVGVTKELHCAMEHSPSHRAATPASHAGCPACHPLPHYGAQFRRQLLHLCREYLQHPRWLGAEASAPQSCSISCLGLPRICISELLPQGRGSQYRSLQPSSQCQLPAASCPAQGCLPSSHRSLWVSGHGNHSPRGQEREASLSPVVPLNAGLRVDAGVSPPPVLSGRAVAFHQRLGTREMRPPSRAGQETPQPPGSRDVISDKWTEPGCGEALGSQHRDGNTDRQMAAWTEGKTLCASSQ